MVAHPALFDVLRDVTIDPDVELTVRVSEATGQMTAMWDSRKGDVKGLPDAVRTGANAALHEDVAGHRFRVSAGSFFQSGPAAAALLVDAVRRAAPEIDGRGACGRRVRRRRVVRSRRGARDESDDEHRDVAFVRTGRLGEPRRTSRDDRAK